MIDCADFLVVMVSPVMINNIGYGTYIVWTVTNLCFIPLIYFLSKLLYQPRFWEFEF